MNLRTFWTPWTATQFIWHWGLIIWNELLPVACSGYLGILLTFWFLYPLYFLDLIPAKLSTIITYQRLIQVELQVVRSSNTSWVITGCTNRLRHVPCNKAFQIYTIKRANRRTKWLREWWGFSYHFKQYKMPLYRPWDIGYKYNGGSRVSY